MKEGSHYSPLCVYATALVFLKPNPPKSTFGTQIGGDGSQSGLLDSASGFQRIRRAHNQAPRPMAQLVSAHLLLETLYKRCVMG